MKAFLRSLEAVPPSTLEEIRPRTVGASDLVLRCFMPGCSSCAKFETEGQASFEETHFRGADIIDFDCRGKKQRNLAMNAGVDDLPAYIVLSASNNKPHAVRPLTS